MSPPRSNVSAAVAEPAEVETTGADPKPSDSYVQSFARGLSVLRSFGAHAPAQTLTEAAQRSGLTRAGARRILLTLQQLGYVETDGRLFRLTPKVLELGFAYLSSQPLWHVAQPMMEDLSRALGESCSAAVLDGDDIVYVLRVPTRQIMTISLGVGSRLPAHCTSMGRVLLAALPEDERRRRIRRLKLQALTPKTVTDPAKLLEVLSQVERRGFAVVGEELELGLVSLAVPVRNRSGRVVAAINVSGRSQKMPATQMQKRFLPELLATAQRIQALMPA